MPDSTPRRTLRKNSSGPTLNDIKELIKTMRSDILDTMKTENRKLNEDIQQILLHLSRLDQANEELKVENRQLKEEMEKLKSAQENTLSQAADELHLRSLRAPNLIIFGVPEIVSGTVLEHKFNDSHFCTTMLKELGIDEDYEHLQRIGKMRPCGVRPLRLKCKSVDQKYRILQISKRLRDFHKYKSVFINPDRTPMQLEKDKKLRQELKRQQLAGRDVIIFKGKVVERSSRENFQDRF